MRYILSNKYINNLQGGFMSGFKKFVHILFSILLIIFSLVMFFTVFKFGQASYNLREPMMNEVCFYILAVIGALVLLGALIIMFKAILSDNLSDFLISKDKYGEVMISTDALENTVKSIVNKFNDVRTSNVNVRVNNSNEPYMNCDVEVGVRDMSNVGGLGENIKNDIKTNLETLTGYKVKDITVKFLDLTKSANKRVVQGVRMNNNNMLDNFQSPDEQKKIIFVKEDPEDKFDERLIKNLSGLRKPTQYGILGVIIALSFLKLGFWATILILLLFGIGYG